MFAAAYYPRDYFPAAYFPKVGGGARGHGRSVGGRPALTGALYEDELRAARASYRRFVGRRAAATVRYAAAVQLLEQQLQRAAVAAVLFAEL